MPDVAIVCHLAEIVADIFPQKSLEKNQFRRKTVKSPLMESSFQINVS